MKRILAGVIMALILRAANTFAHTQEGTGMMHWGSGWGMGGSGWLFMAVFWALVIIGGIYLVKAIVSPKAEGKTESAMDILKKRYAKGEIDREEFEEKKKALT